MAGRKSPTHFLPTVENEGYKTRAATAGATAARRRRAPARPGGHRPDTGAGVLRPGPGAGVLVGPVAGAGADAVARLDARGAARPGPARPGPRGAPPRRRPDLRRPRRPLPANP